MLADYYIIYAFEERSVALIPVGHGVHVCGCLVLCVCVCVCPSAHVFPDSRSSESECVHSRVV